MQVQMLEEEPLAGWWQKLRRVIYNSPMQACPQYEFRLDTSGWIFCTNASIFR